jgi:hypothetical protein
LYGSLIKIYEHIRKTGETKDGGLQVLTGTSMKMDVISVTVLCSLADISEVLAAFIIRAVSKPCTRNWFEIYEPVSQGRTMARAVGNKMSIG